MHGNFPIIKRTTYKLKHTLPLLLFLLLGCANDIELAMERGIHYYEWDRVEEAILEFKYVTQVLGKKINQLNHNNIKLLSRAHHNLAVAYAKKTWYKEAAYEAKKAFDLFPTDNNRKVLELILSKQYKPENLESEKKQRSIR